MKQKISNINIKNKYKSKNISISNNYETSEYNTKKVDNLSTNAVNKFGIQNLKIFLNNKEYEKSANNKKFGKRTGLWNAINEKEKENRHVKSQDNVIKGTNNLLTFHKNKKVTRNISYVTLYNKKKSLPNSKSNISAKIKNNENQLECDRDYYLNEALQQYENHCVVVSDGIHPFFFDPKSETNKKIIYKK